MEVRKLQIRPEDETRLRELLKIHEADIDQLSDDELDEAEAQTSQRLQELLQTQKKVPAEKSVLRFRQPLKTGTMALLAAAAVMLFMQMNTNTTENPQLVTKGLAPAAAVDCDSSVIEAGQGKPQHYLKLRCGQAVFVHLGYLKGQTLHLELSNLSVSAQEQVVMKGRQPFDFTDLAEKEESLRVVVTEKPLDTMDLSADEQAGLWIQELGIHGTR